MKRLFNIDSVLFNDAKVVLQASVPIELSDVAVLRYLLRLCAAGCIDFHSIDEKKVIEYVANSRAISKSA